MNDERDITLNRYVRLLVHDDPNRAREFVDALRAKGWSDQRLGQHLLIPAKHKLQGLRAAHKLNADDVGEALTAVRSTLDGMPLAIPAERRPRRVLRRPATGTRPVSRFARAPGPARVA